MTIAQGAIDTAQQAVADLTVKRMLIDTIVAEVFRSSNRSFNIRQHPLDSLAITSISVQLHPQEVRIRACATLWLRHDRYKARIPLTVSASCSPFFRRDTLFLNPSFNRIVLERIQMSNGWLKCRDISPLRSLLNRILKDYLDNANAFVPDYFLTLPTLGGGTVDLGRYLASDPGTILTGDQKVDLPVLVLGSSVLVTDSSLNLLLQERTHTMYQPVFLDPGIGWSDRRKERMFKQQYRMFIRRYDRVLAATFDPSTAVGSSGIRLRVSTGFAERYLNGALHGLRIGARRSFEAAKDVGDLNVQIRKPAFSCDCKSFCHALHLGRGCRWACDIGKFLPGPVSTAYWGCKTLNTLWPERFSIGWIRGTKLALTGDISLVLEDVRLSNGLGRVDAVAGAGFAGRFRFNSAFNAVRNMSIGSIAFSLLSQCPYFDIHLDLSVHAALQERPIVTLSPINSPTGLLLEFSTTSFQGTLALEPPPAVALFSNIADHFTCPLGMSILGGGVAMATILPDRLYPEGVRDVLAAVIDGGYTYSHQGLRFSVPIRFPVLTKYRPIRVVAKWYPTAIVASGDPE